VFGNALVPSSQNEQHPRQRFQTYNFPKANYLSNKHKIRLPVFAIHGNHDDPIGLQMLSSLDQLNVNSYVNHFGKVMDIENIQVSPVLFSKG
jgi:double-strand break repair protein MRE11